MVQPSSSQAAPGPEQSPEKPQAVRMNAPARATDQQPVQQPLQFQPTEIPRFEPFRNGKVFSVAKLVLGCFNLVFAIIALGLSLDLAITGGAWGDDFIADIIIAVAVRPPPPFATTGTPNNHDPSAHLVILHGRG